MKVTDTKLPLPEFPTLEAIAEPLSTLVQTGLDFFAPAPVSLAWEHRSSLFNAYQQQSPQIKLLIGLAGLAFVAAALPLILELGAVSAVPEVTEGIIGGPAANAMMQGVRIIYVEDELELVTMVQSFLKRATQEQKMTYQFKAMLDDSKLLHVPPHSVEILHFTRADKAEEWALNNLTEFDGILWDNNTPGTQKGWQAMLNMAMHNPELPQALMTHDSRYGFSQLVETARKSPTTLRLATKSDFIETPQWIVAKAIEYSKKRQV